MTYIALDPSITGSGIAVYNEDRTIRAINRVGLESSVANKGIAVQNFACIKVVDMIIDYIDSVSSDDLTVGIEYPAPSMYSMVLPIFHGHLISQLMEKPNVKNLILMNCTACNSYLGIKRSSDKDLIVEKTLERWVLPELENQRFINHDEATAVVLMHVMFDIIDNKYDKVHYVMRKDDVPVFEHIRSNNTRKKYIPSEYYKEHKFVGDEDYKNETT